MKGRAPTEATIRVLVVDDHDLFRTGLASLLSAEPDIEVAAQASGGRMAVRLADELMPDVVLMDCRMPDLSGPDATRQILARHPAMRVLVLTVASDDGNVLAALSAGGSGFLTKDAPIGVVLEAVRAVAQGAAWFSPRAADVVLGHLRSEGIPMDPDAGAAAPLSSRELEVLRLLADGADNAAIAHTLGISPRTAKNHVSSILAKLGVPNRVQAAVYAIRRRMI